MKKSLFAIFFLLFTFSFFARIGGEPAHQGTITSLAKKDNLYLATVRMDPSYYSDAKDPAQKVRPGMSAKLIYSIDTSQFRLSFGRVLKITESGDVIVVVDETLLDKEISDPNSDKKVTVKDLLNVGASVSISNDAV
jgi:hypothetical protein